MVLMLARLLKSVQCLSCQVENSHSLPKASLLLLTHIAEVLATSSLAILVTRYQALSSLKAFTDGTVLILVLRAAPRYTRLQLVLSSSFVIMAHGMAAMVITPLSRMQMVR